MWYTGSLLLPLRLEDCVVYFDLDGVMADYDAGIRAKGFNIDPSVKNDLNRSGTDNPLKREMYEAIKGTNFYGNIPIMPGAKLLWDYVRERTDPIVLTAAPKFGATEDDYYLNPYWCGAAYFKRRWVNKNLFDPSIPPIADENFICTTSKRKHEFMHRRHSDHQILIDDRIDNCKNWVEAGGIAILHESADKTLKLLKELEHEQTN